MGGPKDGLGRRKRLEHSAPRHRGEGTRSSPTLLVHLRAFDPQSEGSPFKSATSSCILPCATLKGCHSSSSILAWAYQARRSSRVRISLTPPWKPLVTTRMSIPSERTNCDTSGKTALTVLGMVRASGTPQNTCPSFLDQARRRNVSTG